VYCSETEKVIYKYTTSDYESQAFLCYQNDNN